MDAAVFTAAFLHVRLADQSENACFAGRNRSKMQVDFLLAVPFCIALTRKLAKNMAFECRRGAKTNNEALHYANCKMPAKAILQVFKLRLQNEKNCAICTKYETRFCRKQLNFSAE